MATTGTTGLIERRVRRQITETALELVHHARMLARDLTAIADALEADPEGSPVVGTKGTARVSEVEAVDQLAAELAEHRSTLAAIRNVRGVEQTAGDPGRLGRW